MGNHRASHRSPQRAPRGSSTRAAQATSSFGTSPGTGTYAGAGKRSAGNRRAAGRSPLLRTRIPAVPSLVGATALLVAGGGVVVFGPQALPGDNTDLSLSAGSHLSGAAASPVSDSRTKAISRDSDRQALQDAADAQLKQAAQKQDRQRNAALAELAKSAEKRAADIKKNQWVLPTQGYRLTATFGMGGGLWSRNHTGLDFAAPVGTPLFAVANGVITETGSAGAYGNRTILTLTDGTEIWYCHQNSIGVTVGQTVAGGDQIGELGNTGNTTGPHLHLEVRPGGGDPVDPYGSLIFHGLTP